MMFGREVEEFQRLIAELSQYDVFQTRSWHPAAHNTVEHLYRVTIGPIGGHPNENFVTENHTLW